MAVISFRTSSGLKRMFPNLSYFETNTPLELRPRGGSRGSIVFLAGPEVHDWLASLPAESSVVIVRGTRACMKPNFEAVKQRRKPDGVFSA